MKTTKIESTDSHLKILKSLNDFLAEIWESDTSRACDIYSKGKFHRFWDNRDMVKEMTPEEVHEELVDIKKMLFEIKSAFDRFTTAKEQRWKDEAARRRERPW